MILGAGTFSYMNITATGDEKSLQQILRQRNKQVDVVHAKDHTRVNVVQRELALIKLLKPVRDPGNGTNRERADSQG